MRHGPLYLLHLGLATSSAMEPSAVYIVYADPGDVSSSNALRLIVMFAQYTRREAVEGCGFLFPFFSFLCCPGAARHARHGPFYSHSGLATSSVMGPSAICIV